TSALWVLPIGAMTAGFVLGQRQAVGFALACTVAIVGLGFAADAGLLPPHADRSTWYSVAVIVIVLLCAAILGVSSMSRYRNEFLKSQALGHKLAVEVAAATSATQRMHAVFEANPLPSTIVDAAGRIVDCNAAWQAVTGLARAEVIGRRGIDLGIWSDP